MWPTILATGACCLAFFLLGVAVGGILQELGAATKRPRS